MNETKARRSVGKKGIIVTLISFKLRVVV